MAKADPETPSSGLRLALVGAAGPLGAEVKRRLGDGRVPIREVVLAEFDPEDEEGGRRLGEFAGEAQLVADVAATEFERFDLAVLCGDPAGTAAILERAARAATCLDLSGATRRRPDVAWFHAALAPPREWPKRGLVAAPQPPAFTLAALLAPPARAGMLAAASATVLLPAATLGDKALEELYQQSVALLNFTELPRAHLGAQLAFNVQPWEHPARPGSGGLAEDLAWEVGRFLPEGAPPVDLNLLLAPAFHGHAYSIRLELAGGADAGDLAESLRSSGIGVAPGGPASPAEVVESAKVQVSRLRSVRPGTCWLWAVADSLGSGAAESIRRLAASLAGAGESGRRSAGAKRVPARVSGPGGSR